MRISDWSSDVCSSDLEPDHRLSRDPRFSRQACEARAVPPGGARDGGSLAARRLSERPVTAPSISRRELIAAGALVAANPAWAAPETEERREGTWGCSPGDSRGALYI